MTRSTEKPHSTGSGAVISSFTLLVVQGFLQQLRNSEPRGAGGAGVQKTGHGKASLNISIPKHDLSGTAIGRPISWDGASVRGVN